MGGLFGKKDKTKPEYTGIQTQTASSTLPVPLIWGSRRVAPNLFYYTDFKAHKQKQKTGKGGSRKQVTYTYSATIMMGLCEGGNSGISGIGKAWIDMSKKSGPTQLGELGYSLFYGTPSQTAWSYLVSKHPSEALDYKGFAYLAVANYDLGSSASTPQHSFEVKGMRYQSGNNGGDADPALVIDDFLTHPSLGVGFPASSINLGSFFSSPLATSIGDSAYQTYCKAMGFAMSPALSNLEAAGDVLIRWTKLTNTALYFNGVTLKFIPYGDEDVTANGVKWIAPIGVVYDISLDDVIRVDDGNPIKLHRKDPSELKNIYRLEISERSNDYNKVPVEWRDLDLVEKFGESADGTFQAEEICETEMASKMIQLYGLRQSYIRNSYSFMLDPRYIRLEPMDVVQIHDTIWGSLLVRLTEITEDEDGNLEVRADEFPRGTSSSSGFTTNPVTNTPQNSSSPPGPVNTPIIFEPPTTLTTNGAYQVWAAISGGNNNDEAGEFWGGAAVWVSTDDATYTQIGQIDASSTMGVLSATLSSFAGTNPDTAGELKVDLRRSAGELISVTPQDAALNVSLCYVDGELLSYTEAELTDVGRYTLTDLYRAQYGTPSPSHATGGVFTLLDGDTFKYDLPAQFVGVPLYFKFQSFNLWGDALQDLSDCVAYTFTPQGGGLPAAPGGLSATGGLKQITTSWSLSTSPGVSEYRVYAYNGLSIDFNDGILVGTTNTNSFIHTGLGSLDQWTYWVTSISLGGESAPAGPVNATTDA